MVEFQPGTRSAGTALHTFSLIPLPDCLAHVMGNVSTIGISLRSKGQVDVARFAEKFGGGGHARASGLKLETTMAEAHDRVVGEMVRSLAAIGTLGKGKNCNEK